MRIIPGDSVLDPERAPTCQACPRAMAHPGLQTKRNNAVRDVCKSILQIDPSNLDTQTHTLLRDLHTEPPERAVEHV